jgi:hypothetical protein
MALVYSSNIDKNREKESGKMENGKWEMERGKRFSL